MAHFADRVATSQQVQPLRGFDTCCEVTEAGSTAPAGSVMNPCDRLRSAPRRSAVHPPRPQRCDRLGDRLAHQVVSEPHRERAVGYLFEHREQFGRFELREDGTLLTGTQRYRSVAVGDVEAAEQRVAKNAHRRTATVTFYSHPAPECVLGSEHERRRRDGRPASSARSGEEFVPAQVGRVGDAVRERRVPGACSGTRARDTAGTARRRGLVARGVLRRRRGRDARSGSVDRTARISRGGGPPTLDHCDRGRRGTAWGIGMLPSTLSDLGVGIDWGSPLTWTIVGVAGLVLLATIPVAQWTVLRERLPRAWRWIPLNMGAWCIGLVFTFLPSPFVDEDTPAAVMALAFAVAGVCMAATVAMVTGFGLVRMMRARVRVRRRQFRVVRYSCRDHLPMSRSKGPNGRRHGGRILRHRRHSRGCEHRTGRGAELPAAAAGAGVARRRRTRTPRHPVQSGAHRGRPAPRRGGVGGHVRRVHRPDAGALGTRRRRARSSTTPWPLPVSTRRTASSSARIPTSGPGRARPGMRCVAHPVFARAGVEDRTVFWARIDAAAGPELADVVDANEVVPANVGAAEVLAMATEQGAEVGAWRGIRRDDSRTRRRHRRVPRPRRPTRRSPRFDAAWVRRSRAHVHLPRRAVAHPARRRRSRCPRRRPGRDPGGGVAHPANRPRPLRTPAARPGAAAWRGGAARRLRVDALGGDGRGRAPGGDRGRDARDGRADLRELCRWRAARYAAGTSPVPTTWPSSTNSRAASPNSG